MQQLVLKRFGLSDNLTKNKMNILTDYKIQFFNRQGFGKNLLTINGMLTGYLSDHYYLSLANLLLTEIDSVLNGEKTIGGWDTQSMYLAKISVSETKIYQDMEAWEENNNISPDCVLPTAHFKVIVQAWRDYLMQ